MANVWIQSAVVNHKGLIRVNNEDNFLLNGTYMQLDRMDDGASISANCRDTDQIYAVCDGMGGADSGEEASFCAVRELADRKEHYRDYASPEALTTALRDISETVSSEAQKREQKSGTTVAMVLINGNRICISNVGDSRVYRFRDGALTQVSVDHSKVQRMVTMGLLTPEQAKTDPSRHVISQYLGMPSDIRIVPQITADRELRRGDVYLLCSDGLTDLVEDQQIESILRTGTEPERAATALVNAALENGGRDNVTVMIVRAESVQDAEGAPARHLSIAGNFLTVLQIIVGGGLLITALDYLQSLFHWFK